MSEENYTHNFELIGGYTDKENNIHTEVTFGKRPTVADLMALDNDPQSQNATQYEDLIRRLMITKFGSLKMPVVLNVLLALDTIDRDDLGEAANEFLIISRGERKGELLKDNEVRLAFGLKIESTTYDTIKFGHRLIGKDEVQADTLGFKGVSRLCFQMTKQISQLSDSETGLTLDCVKEVADEKDFVLKMDHLSKLDGEDFNLLRTGAEFFRQSFRFKRKDIPGNANGKSSVLADENNGNVGDGNPESADGTN